MLMLHTKVFYIDSSYSKDLPPWPRAAPKQPSTERRPVPRPIVVVVVVARRVLVSTCCTYCYVVVVAVTATCNG
jgi:hypothetical protein